MKKVTVTLEVTVTLSSFLTQLREEISKLKA